MLPESTPQNERNTPSPIDPDCVEVEVNFNPDPADLVLSSVPGGELFNPRKHKFTEEDLKPQPMIKKAKKVFVPDEQKVTDLLLQTPLGLDKSLTFCPNTLTYRANAVYLHDWAEALPRIELASQLLCLLFCRFCYHELITGKEQLIMLYTEIRRTIRSNPHHLRF